MTRMLKGIFSLALLFPALVSADSCFSGNSCGFGGGCNNNGTTTFSSAHSYFSIRSQSVNDARELAGWQTQINLFDRECFYGSFTITPEYTQSFRPCSIANFLFGPDLQFNAFPTSTTLGTTVPGFNTFGCNTSCNTSCNNGNGNNGGALVISGSCAPNRGAQDWLADNFGLPADFRSVVSFCPRIQTFLVDFNLYLGLDEWMCGMYFRIHAPVVWTRWDLRASEFVTNAGSQGYVAGYMASGTVTNSSLRHSWISAMDGTYTFGDMTDTLKFGRICNTCNVSTTTNVNFASTRQTRTALSDIEAALGWNFWQCEDYFLGVGIRGAAPTGTRPCGGCLFEPTIGNGKHWELGGQINAMAVLWRGCDDDRYFGVWMDANITHLFRTRQTRSFDLIGKPNSRYMLVEEMTSTVAGLQSNAAAVGAAPVAGFSIPNAQYNKILHPLINLTTLDVNVSIAVQGDFVLKFAYVSCDWELDLGYELWGRSGEQFCPRCAPVITANKFALKGDAQIYGFTQNSATTPTPPFTPVALSATENAATIHGGTNASSAAFTCGGASTNPNIDNFQFAYTGAAAVPFLTSIAGSGALNQINTSNPAVFIKATDIDLSNSPSALSNKVFGSINYYWNDCDDWIPFLGLGFEAEFGSCTNNNNNNNNCNNNNNGCVVGSTSGTFVNCNGNNCNAAVSQWGVWLKGGLSFN